MTEEIWNHIDSIREKMKGMKIYDQGQHGSSVGFGSINAVAVQRLMIPDDIIQVELARRKPNRHEQRKANRRRSK